MVAMHTSHSSPQCIAAYYNMTAWIFGAKLQWLPLTVGCVAVILMPLLIWFVVIMLKPATYTSKKQSHVCLWWLVILYEWFWERQINLPALTGHIVLLAWWRSSCTRTLHDRMCKATTLIIKDRFVTSQWSKVGDVARLFSGDFESISL